MTNKVNATLHHLRNIIIANDNLRCAYSTYMVFNLYAIEGYSHKEISALLNISEGTSKSNLSRARAILQKKLKNYYKITRVI